MKLESSGRGKAKGRRSRPRCALDKYSILPPVQCTTNGLEVTGMMHKNSHYGANPGHDEASSALDSFDGVDDAEDDRCRCRPDRKEGRSALPSIGRASLDIVGACLNTASSRCSPHASGSDALPNGNPGTSPCFEGAWTRVRRSGGEWDRLDQDPTCCMRWLTWDRLQESGGLL